jgi:hypothetical protein
MSEVPPPPPDLENKFQRNIGILIGLGLGLLLLGFFGLMISNQNYNDVARYVNYEGTRNGNWLFRDLTRQIAIFSTFTITGAIAIFWGWLKLSKSDRQQLSQNYPIRNMMRGGGGAIAFFFSSILFYVHAYWRQHSTLAVFTCIYGWSCCSCLQFCSKKLIG